MNPSPTGTPRGQRDPVETRFPAIHMAARAFGGDRHDHHRTAGKGLHHALDEAAGSRSIDRDAAPAEEQRPQRSAEHAVLADPVDRPAAGEAREDAERKVPVRGMRIHHHQHTRARRRREAHPPAQARQHPRRPAARPYAQLRPSIVLARIGAECGGMSGTQLRQLRLPAQSGHVERQTRCNWMNDSRTASS